MPWQVYLIILLPSLNGLVNQEGILMVRDVLATFQPTPLIYGFLCEHTDKVSLLRSFFESGFRVSVHEPVIDPLLHSLPSLYVVFVLDLECSRATQFLIEINETRSFAAPHRWLWINLSHNAEIQELVFDLDIFIDSQILVANYEAKNKYRIKEMYKRGSGLPAVEEDVGEWTLQEGFLEKKQFRLATARRRNNLFGTVLNVCLVITHNDSLNHLRDRRDKHIDTIAKVNYVLVKHLGNVINASLTYSVQPTWGYKNNNSGWSGMIGELQRNEAQIGGTPLFMTSDRIGVIDYIAMTTPTRSKFIFRQPKLSYVTNVFTLPFHWSVWISVVALVFATAFGLYVTTKWERHKRRLCDFFKKEEEDPNELRGSWIEALFLSVCSLLQQGASMLPYGISGRIIAIFMFISLMFLYTSYSANIVALLQSSSNSIHTLADLLQSRLSVGVDDTVFNRFYFPAANEPIRKQIYLKKVAPPGQVPRYYTIIEGVKKMRQGLFAFHVETGAGYKVVEEIFEEHEKCGLQEIQYLQVPDPWLAIQMNLPHKEILKIGLRQIHESGLQSREVSLLYTKKPVCVSRGSSFISVGIIDCYPAAVVFGGGIFIAFVVFLLELLVYRRLHFHRATSERIYLE